MTFYDDATGERVELSVVTFDNWVSKVANLMAVEIGADPGEVFAARLPPHWLGAVTVVGGWAAGLALADAARSDDAVVRVVGPAQVRTAQVGADRAAAARQTTVACSLRPLGARFSEPLPPGWLDFAVEVSAQPDTLLPAHQVADRDAAVVGGRDWCHGDLVEAGERVAGEVGLERGGRLATDLCPTDPEDLLTCVAAPLAVLASVVLVVNATSERRTAIAEQERVTATKWGEQLDLAPSIG